MKNILFIIVLVFIVMHGCTSQESPQKGDYPFTQHILYLSFHDASGNDLVKLVEFLTITLLAVRNIRKNMIRIIQVEK